jgi:hypothetical protein
MSMGDEYRAFNNFLHSFDMMRSVAQRRAGVPALHTKADIVDADVRTLNDDDFIGERMDRLRSNVEQYRLPPGEKLALLERIRNTGMNTVKNAWPMLRRSTKLGMRKYLRAHFGTLNELIRKELWEGFEVL